MRRGLLVAMLIVGIAWAVRRWRAGVRATERSRVPVRAFHLDDANDLNEALRTYLGSTRDDRGVRPWATEERVREAYGEDADAALAEVHRVLDAIVVPDRIGQRATLQEIGQFAEKAARALRDNLDDDVCEAIGNYVSFSYK